MNVPQHQRRNHAIVAEKQAISPVTARTLRVVEAVACPLAEDIVEEVAVEIKNATNVVRWATSLATVWNQAAEEVMEEEATVAGVAAMEQQEEEEAMVAVPKTPATLVVVTVICLATVPKVKNVTTVGPCLSLHITKMLTCIGGEVGHLSRDCPSETTSERVCYKCKQPGHVQAACPA